MKKGQRGMNILVTGVAGFIGSHLCRALLEGNHEVFALSRSGTNERVASLLSQGRFHLVAGDVCYLPTMQEVMERNKVDAVIHLAAYVPHGPQGAIHNPTYLDNNVKGTLNVLQASLQAKCSMVIYASSRDVYGMPEYLPIDENHPRKPLNFYGLTKLQGEAYCQFYAENYGLHVVVLRYAGVYGPGKNDGAVYNFIRAASKNQPFQISSDGNQTRDLVYVRDVASATVKALEIVRKSAFDVFNIGSGRETSLNELATKVIDITGSNSDFSYVPRNSDDRFVLDIRKAQRALDYRPHSLDNALDEFVDFLKSGV